MIPDVSQALAWLEKHPQALKGIQRGLERETLRVNADGRLATTGHPEALGFRTDAQMDYYRFCGSITGIHYTSGW
ncbi:glutamate--cysteine ligase [Escherichia coli]|uniref:Glutamate--cysteine ligase n=1 Tax=Escherichia coli TaxID=562 RepID=A0A376SBA8_ECOLX|nr:glutamate--cysteine ligase [Escherichia coli]